MNFPDFPDHPESGPHPDFYEEDFHLTPEEELDFDRECERPEDSYRFKDTLTLTTETTYEEI